MRTVPTNFVPFQNRLDARYATIVKITNNGSTWYLGDMEIDWGAIHVYALLKSHSGMKDATDPFSKKWSVGEVTLSFANLPFKIDGSGNWLRPSDDIDIVETDAVDIYLLSGENATGLSDCILYFSGLLKETPKCDENTWSITVVDRSVSLMNQMIPATTVGSIYSDTPDEYQQEPIPLVYGDFEYEMESNNNTGLARGVPINNDTPPKCVFSDHILYSFSRMYHQESGVNYAGYYNWFTPNTNDSGRGTGEPTNQQVRLNIPFENSNHYGYDIHESGPWPLYGSEPLNADNAHDLEVGSYAAAKDTVDDGTDVYFYAAFGFSDGTEGIVESLLNKAITESISTDHGYCFRYNIGPHPGITIAAASMLLYSGDFYDNFSDLNCDHVWRVTGIDTSDTMLTKQLKYALLIVGRSDGIGDGTEENQDLARIYEIWIRINYDHPGGEFKWGRIEGREFGSWIDGAGHLVDDQGYDAGDLIEDPAYIIESLLRDELSWATANIDEASFDAAANTSVVMRMNLTKQATVAKIIRQICEQSTFAFHVNGAGKAKLIPLNDSSPSTDRTIPFSHIKANTLRATKVGPFVNYMTYHSCWLPQLGKYRDVYTGNDITSWATYGKHEHTVYWPNIEGSSVTHIGVHLIGISGLWSRPRNVIEFETVHFTNADIEIGDWIELDDETWDAQLKQMGGASWSGGQFLVTEVTQKQNGTRIKAIGMVTAKAIPAKGGELAASMVIGVGQLNVVMDSLLITPTTVAMLTDVAQPTVVLSSLSITPAAASIVVDVAQPVVNIEDP